jgi:sulfate adenylyltransferase (ADP) / ATP adenylyltransferase
MSLWQRVSQQSRVAEREGGLEPFASEVLALEDDGIEFTVRVLTQVAHASRTVKSERDPFSPPYEASLFVGDVTKTHVAILNKYNVLPDHVLVVTRAYESQEALLTRADFEAWWPLLNEGDALGFYNAGGRAGASQPHKHMQAVPLVDTRKGRTPFDRALVHGGLPFAYALAGFESDPIRAHAAYWKLLREVDCAAPGASYNLLVTRDFMWVVPRRAGGHDGIGVNALGYAGSLAVRDRATLDKLRVMGPLRLLTQVGRARRE